MTPVHTMVVFHKKGDRYQEAVFNSIATELNLMPQFYRDVLSDLVSDYRLSAGLTVMVAKMINNYRFTGSAILPIKRITPAVEYLRDNGICEVKNGALFLIRVN